MDIGIIQVFQQGGPVMFAILGCSIVALAVFLERLFYLRGGRQLPNDIISQLHHLSAQSIPTLSDHLRTNPKPFHKLLLKVFEFKHLSPDEIQHRLSAQLHQTQQQFEKYSDILATVTSVSPLLGLLGTVTGMMKIFKAVRYQGLAGSPALMASGIGEALINTVAGLIVAILSLVAYKIVLARAAYLTERIEKYLDTTYERLNPTSSHL